MSDVEWDADDFVPPPPPLVITDKWEGEDEEEEVKESWEDDEEKKEEESGRTTTTASKKKKKKLTEILAEKEKKQLEEMERRRREKEEEKKNKSPEEVLAEKLRIQKIQEDSDFKLAADLMGDKTETTTSLDAFDLTTSSSLNGFRLALIKKIKSIDRLEKRPFYVTFLEDLCRDLCENMDMDDIKKVTSVLNALYNEKVKANKPSKGKKKAAGKAKLNVGTNAIADQVDTINTYDDFDEYDFI